MLKEEIKNFILMAKKKDKVAGAYMIYGADTEEREEIAIFLSKAVNCQQKTACGKCDTCRLIENKTYPDVKWVIPGKNILSIDEVRWLKEDIFITPYTGKKKVYIFKIDYMREVAASAFLKILEEPPSYGIILILSGNINFFLPTILSRCQKLQLNYKPAEYDREMVKTHQEFTEILKNARNKKYYDFFQKISAMVKDKEREEIETWLEQILWLYRDSYLREHNFPDTLMVNREVKRDMDNRGNIIENMDRILDLKSKIKYNINQKLGLENLILHLI
jgi:hypothetical protein